jgi:hypothetical protein
MSRIVTPDIVPILLTLIGFKTVYFAAQWNRAPLKTHPLNHSSFQHFDISNNIHWDQALSQFLLRRQHGPLNPSCDLYNLHHLSPSLVP